MVNTKIRLIIVFAAKDGEAVHSQQKQDRELTVAQIDALLYGYKQEPLKFILQSDKLQVI